MSELHVVTGLPCSGKTTLCRELASALGGSAVIVGDLIRAAREDSHSVTRETQLAFEGRQEYSPRWLAGLIAPILRNSQGPVVLDGAAPLDRVLVNLGIPVASVLVVDTSERVRAERFDSRRATGARRDDSRDTFHQRTKFHEASFLRLRSLAPRERVFTLAGDRPIHELLRQALAAIVVTRHAMDRPQFVQDDWPHKLGLGAWVVESIQTARDAGCAIKIEQSPALDPARNAPVLLFKPGHTVSADLVGAVLDRFDAAGYSPVAAAVWPGRLIATSQIAPAHFELHYLLARWAHTLTGLYEQGKSAYEVIGAGHSAGNLSAWWHGRPKPTKVARACWVKEDDTNVPVVNGHVPAMIEAWQHPESTAVVIGLMANSGAQSWQTLRADVLGGSDPASAKPSSLRSLAFEGQLPTRESVNLSANLLHLSASPVEAIRERWLWLGGVGDESGNDLIDSPAQDGAWLYEQTEHQDVQSFSVPGRHVHSG